MQGVVSRVQCHLLGVCGLGKCKDHEAERRRHLNDVGVQCCEGPAQSQGAFTDALWSLLLRILVACIFGSWCISEYNDYDYYNLIIIIIMIMI